MYFRNFIATGDPNGGGLPEWNRSTGAGKVQELGLQTGETDAPYQDLYAVLDEMFSEEMSK